MIENNKMTKQTIKTVIGKLFFETCSISMGFRGGGKIVIFKKNGLFDSLIPYLISSHCSMISPLWGQGQ